MNVRGRFAGLALLTFGVLLLAWLLYDATSVLTALRLDGTVSEAGVALAGLAVAAAAVASGLWSVRRARA